MYYYHEDIKTVVAELESRCERKGGIVVSGFTALVVHGCMNRTVSISLDVSSHSFRDLTEGLPPAKIQKVSGAMMCSPRRDVYIREGINLGEALVNGVRTYSLTSIKDRAELLASRPGHTGWSDACSMLSSIQHHEREVEEAASRKAAEEAARLKVVTDRQTAEERFLKDADPELIGYVDRCKRADWYYSYSDDIAAYRLGKEVCTKLEAEARTKGGMYLEVYRHYSSK